MIKYVSDFFVKREKIYVNGSIEFNNAVRISRSHCDDLDCFNQKIAFLEYVLRTVKADFITSYNAKVFYKEHVNPREARIMPFSVDLIGDEIELNLNSVDVFALPWKINSITTMLNRLKNEVFKHDANNHFATVYYPYMNICHADNGIHSILIGKYYNKGNIVARQYDMEKAFRLYKTDGDSWFLKETGEKIDDVFDFRIAIIFEICRMIYAIKQSNAKLQKSDITREVNNENKR